MSTIFIDKEYSYIIKLQKLINEARADGIVIGINNQPRYPLASGHFDMIPEARYSRGAKGSKLWMLHIEGPDDIVAAPSFEEAIEVRDDFNAYWHEYNAKRAEQGMCMGNMPTLRAVIKEWEGTEGEHADSVVCYWPDYIGFGGPALIALKAAR